MGFPRLRLGNRNLCFRMRRGCFETKKCSGISSPREVHFQGGEIRHPESAFSGWRIPASRKVHFQGGEFRHPGNLAFKYFFRPLQNDRRTTVLAAAASDSVSRRKAENRTLVTYPAERSKSLRQGFPGTPPRVGPSGSPRGRARVFARPRPEGRN